MIISNQIVKEKWTRANKSYYEEKGYLFTNFGEEFEVNSKDLRFNSKVKVKVCCDVCGKEFYREFYRYLKFHDKEYGDCCRKCNRLIAKRTNKEKYGVDWCLQREDFKQKQINTCRDRYGVDYISQDENFRKTVIESCKEKYGVENVSRLPEIQNKKWRNYYDGTREATSKQQKELALQLEKIYGNCELNKKVGRYSLDCYVVINGIAVDVEYDGKFWHDRPGVIEKDNRRDNFLNENGIKVLRFVSKNKLPKEEEIISAMFEAIENNRIIKNLI